MAAQKAAQNSQVTALNLGTQLDYLNTNGFAQFKPNAQVYIKDTVAGNNSNLVFGLVNLAEEETCDSLLMQAQTQHWKFQTDMVFRAKIEDKQKELKCGQQLLI